MIIPHQVIIYMIITNNKTKFLQTDCCLLSAVRRERVGIHSRVNNNGSLSLGTYSSLLAVLAIIIRI